MATTTSLCSSLNRCDSENSKGQSLTKIRRATQWTRRRMMSAICSLWFSVNMLAVTDQSFIPQLTNTPSPRAHICFIASTAGCLCRG